MTKRRAARGAGKSNEQDRHEKVQQDIAGSISNGVYCTVSGLLMKTKVPFASFVKHDERGCRINCTLY